MQFGLDWLKEYLEKVPTPDVLEQSLPAVGFEIEHLAPAGKSFSGVVVAEVINAIQHPNADRLCLCLVSDGEQQYNVVCGAPNVRAGIRVALARVGAVLPDGMRIKQSKIRGEVSCGMLCSESELGISPEQSSIMELPEHAKLGSDIRELLNLDEYVIDVDITPNRGDCLSVRGIAREIAAVSKEAFKDKILKAVEPILSDTRDINIMHSGACPRYVGRIIKLNINGADSPQWLRNRVVRAGLRPIGLVVDITNLVMLALGQPLHAFDNDKLSGAICVRTAQTGEKLTLLTEQQLELDEDHLVIADDSGAIALAGIMGGASTEIDDDSEYIFLEAACFLPHAIAGRARHFGLNTDASIRFERGVDCQLPLVAIEMATQLLAEYAQAIAGPIVDVINHEYLPKQNTVSCDIDHFNRLAGTFIDQKPAMVNLGLLGFDTVVLDNAKFSVRAPSWRYDIECPEDIFEEVLRMHGFSNVPDELPTFSRPVDFGSDNVFDSYRLMDHLVGLGYQEVVSYSFLDETEQNNFLEDGYQSIGLANPISTGLSCMRYSLSPSLLKTIGYNLRRQHKNLRIFETSLCFRASLDDQIEQRSVLAMATVGYVNGESWNEQKRQMDFYDIKGDVESLLSLVVPKSAVSFVDYNQKGYHPGQTAQIFIGDRPAGIVGAVHPGMLSSFDLEHQNPFVCQLDLEILCGYQKPEYHAVSVYPGVYRDMALVLDKDVMWKQIHDLIFSLADDTLVRVQPFDLYQHANIGAGKKSIALRLYWQSHEGTLTDSCIQQQFDVIIEGLGLELQAALRA